MAKNHPYQGSHSDELRKDWRSRIWWISRPFLQNRPLVVGAMQLFFPLVTLLGLDRERGDWARFQAP